MSKSTVVFEGGIDSVRTMADGSLKITLETPELPPETMSNIFNLNKRRGYVVVSTNPIPDEMVDTVKQSISTSGIESKTPSQKLRNVLYLVWENQQPQHMDEDGNMVSTPFALYYNTQMKSITDHFKEKI
tara:strand:- start:9248 stop:9637 length:390 start_codon:yes stop_codon:yes gene_type:complete